MKRQERDFQSEKDSRTDPKESHGREDLSHESPDPAVDSGLSCFLMIAHFHEIQVRPEQIRHAFAVSGKIREIDLLRSAKAIGLKAKAADVGVQKLANLVYPLIACLQDGEFLVVARADEEGFLVVYPKENTPRRVSFEEMESVYCGRVLLFQKRFWKKTNERFGFRWFIPDILKYKKPLLRVLLAAFTMQVLGLFSPMMMQVVIDKVLVHHSLTTLDVLSVGLFCILVFETVLSMARARVFAHATCGMDVMLGARLFGHLFSLPFRYFEVRRAGDTIARVRELENIRQFLTGSPLTLVLDLLFLFLYLAVMMFYSRNLTFIVLMSLPLFALLSALVTPLFQERLQERFFHGARQQSYLVESIHGVQTVKSFALEPRMQRKWEELIANYIRSSFRTGILSADAGAVAQFIQKSFDLLILWMGARLVMESKLSVGQLIAFRMLSSKVSTPVLRLVQMWQDFQQTGLSMQRLGDIFHTKPEPSIDPSKVALPPIEGTIRFEKVRFRYQSEADDVLRDLSFEIPKGTVVGIVGRSGSGKSTLSKLVQRLYIPQSGKILIDGVDLALADPAWLRRQIGVVLQENFLFYASVRENIAIHHPSAAMEDIIRSAKIAGAHEFILGLPNGYDTMVGENGTGLSGGQKQRIAIARALLADPRILIFDEATSALDYESESIIQRNLKQICQGRTVLIIAHRLSTLKDAHRILAIDKGMLIEYGTPQDLLSRRGLYHYLHEQQERGMPS
ncbi:MAG: type I secretion system permease/ATPase [Peptostreptococcaceae bacterium]|nr:type I secretion system permease/ATPase [Peptostreptococcaceae bacterium]